MLRAANWGRHWHRSLSVTGSRLPAHSAVVNSSSQLLIYEPLHPASSTGSGVVNGQQQRAIHNSRNNEGILNKTIRWGSFVGRRCVTMTAGRVDSVFGTQYLPKIFSFQVDIVKVVYVKFTINVNQLKKGLLAMVRRVLRCEGSVCLLDPVSSVSLSKVLSTTCQLSTRV